MNQLTAEFTNFYNKYSHKYVINLKQDGQRKVLISIYVIFTLVTVSILTIFAIQPAISTVSGLQQQLLQDKQVEAALNSKLNAMDQLDTAYETLTPNLPFVYQAVPKQPSIPYLTREVETMAKQSGLTVTNFTFDTLELYPAQRQNQELFSFTFQIVVNGSQDGINSFLSNLIFFDRIISIERITSGRSDAGGVQASITGRAYYFNQ